MVIRKCSTFGEKIRGEILDVLGMSQKGGGVLEVGKLAFYAITKSCGWGQTIRLEKLVWTDLVVSQSDGTFVELSIDMFENLAFLMKSR